MAYIFWGFFAVLGIFVWTATWLSVKDDPWPPKDSPFWLDL